MLHSLWLFLVLLKMKDIFLLCFLFVVVLNGFLGMGEN